MGECHHDNIVGALGMVGIYHAVVSSHNHCKISCYEQIQFTVVHPVSLLCYLFTWAVLPSLMLGIMRAL